MRENKEDFSARRRAGILAFGISVVVMAMIDPRGEVSVVAELAGIIGALAMVLVDLYQEYLDHLAVEIPARAKRQAEEAAL